MQTMAPPEDATAERFARIDERFDRTDERIADVDRRIAEASEETNRRFEEVNRRITETSAATNKRLNNVESEMGGLRQEVRSLHGGIHRATVSLWIAGAGVIAAILAKGG
jgi:hypothetical protein